MKKIWWLIIGGLLAGIVNGLLGTGGGIILIFLLGKIMKNIERKDIFATTLTVTLVLSVVSIFVYMKKGGFYISQDSLKYVISAGIGGFIGAFLLEKLKVGFVKKLFGVLVIVAGLNMTGII